MADPIASMAAPRPTTARRTTSRPLAASSADLPPAVAAALAAPSPGNTRTVDAAGLTWATVEWGDPTAAPLLLVHGVTSDGGTWWRVGPALAATGRRVVAVDLPGHGRTGGWNGRHRFRETAEDLAAFVRAAGLDAADAAAHGGAAPPALAVLGHSWGAVVAAHLPIAGLRPATLVLLDPPALSVPELELLSQDPLERPHATVAEAAAVVRAANLTWSDGDVQAKAEGLCRFDPGAVLAVLLENGRWDAGLAALRDPAAAGVPAWLIRGEWATGCLIPDSYVPAIAAQLGAGRVITIGGAPHSPQRTPPRGDATGDPARPRRPLKSAGGVSCRRTAPRA